MGRERFCKCHAPVPIDPASKRAIRAFGGRKVVLRAENDGLCDPERCAEYQNRQCNLSGRFLFFIPGIPSLQAFELQTNSFYAMNAAIQRFETVAFMRGGRISGFLDMKRTPFFISKRLMEVPHIDAEWRPVRVSHWIIELEAPVDVTALLRDSDDDVVASRAAQAVQILQGPADTSTLRDEPADPKGAPTGAAPSIAGARPSTPTEEVTDKAPAAPVASSSGPSAASKSIPTRPPAIAAGPSLDDVLSVARSFGITADRYSQYAAKRWGEGWKLNVGGRRRALTELEEFVPDPDRFVDKVEVELDAFS